MEGLVPATPPTLVGRGPSTDPNRTESESLSNNCGKNNGEMSNGMGGEELVTEEELVIKEELVMEEKLEMEEEIEMKDLEGPE